MRRRQPIRHATLAIAVCWIMVSCGAVADRPNILWITAEDMSPTLGCYDDSFATTPCLDQLATQSSRYTHAFATAPVCSPSRACLINGCIATTLGTHPMRSLFPLPAELGGFPAVLRRAGYYTTNNVKTDYNTSSEKAIIRASWDDSSASAHWRGRRRDQPFFSVFNLMTSHQSRTMVWPQEQFAEEIQSKLSTDEIHDPAGVPLPPYYPDTPLVRKTVARYYDCVTLMDKQVGEFLGQLEKDGLVDNTIVFFYSDHGSGMPRHKRALFDSGMRVPLLIRFPKKYQSLAPSAAGGSVDRLVCFEDFGPSVLSLAGIPTIPDFMRGQAFLGPLESSPRSYVFGHRDRVDEVMDMARSVRSKDYLYIRNFMPHLGWNQQNAWSDQAAIRRDFYALAASGEATPAQAQYLNPARPTEELYDCRADPLNLKNLARSPKHQSVLAGMRQTLRQHMIDSRDLGLVPEIELRRQTKGTTPKEWGHSGHFDAELLLRTAELVGGDDFASIRRCLSHQNPSVRYWAAVSCRAATALPPELSRRLAKALDDGSQAVCIQAADAIAHHSQNPAALQTLVGLLDQADQTVVLHAARTIELLGDPSARVPMQELADRFQDEPGDIAWFVRFTTSGYLSRL